MILVFDAGNTETVLGLFDDGALLDHWRLETRPDRTVDELGLLTRALLRESGFDPDMIRAAAIASVVPPLTPAIAAMCERHLGADVAIVDSQAPLPVHLDVDEPLTVGADRIVNTLAAATLYKRDTIAVDFGTATTFDCITRDATFIGGVISPGLRTSAENLVRRTAKLPRVDLDRPRTVIGRRTETALQSGIFFASVDAIDGIVRRIKAEWDRPDAFVVATGGLATLIGTHCATVDLIEPYLTLYGLEMAWTSISAARADGAPPAARKPVPETGRFHRT
ncbi:MAG: type III pantothenate kinase [Longimicrobiales bacterium]